MSLKCYYHPDREATEKCETCEKLICIECKKSISRTHGSSESRYATQHDLCKPCYYDNEMEKYRPPSRNHRIVAVIFPIIDLILIIIVLDGGFQNTGALIPIIAFLSVLSLLAVISYIVGRKRFPAKLAKLKTKKEKFFKILQTGSVCQECGNKVETGISICPSCGSDIAS